MNANSIKSLYNQYSKQYSESLAFEMLMDKYPEAEDQLYELRDGKQKTTEVNVQSQALFTNVNPADSALVASEPDVAAAVFDSMVNPPAIDLTTVKKTRKKAEKKPVEVSGEVEVKEKKVSKAQQAFDIYVAAEDKSRAAITKVFIEQLGMTAAGASTYMQNCKKRFESQQASAQ